MTADDLAQRAMRAAREAIARALADGDAAFAESLVHALEGLAADPPAGPAMVDPDRPSARALDATFSRKAPFPWFGGKQHAADLVWRALGDVHHYVEPFCGSLAVLLRRPHPANRTTYSETVNDKDVYIVNVWRSIVHDPVATARWASWPVTEVDVMARHLWLLRWSAEHADRLRANPDYHDPRAAGYWLYGISAWIGARWCSGNGPWTVGEDGRIARRSGDDPGVIARIPALSNIGRGVHHPRLREPGARHQHPMTMPNLIAWFTSLAARLRHVRIVAGDWRRVVTPGATMMLPIRMGNGVCGIFFDPPYAPSALRDPSPDLYPFYDHDAAAGVRAWCLEHGDNPNYRIVLAGFAGEGHEILESHGWRCVSWFQPGFCRGGYGVQSSNGHQQDRERLWLSPHCLPVDDVQRSTVIAHSFFDLL